MNLYLKLFIGITVLMCAGCEKNGWIEPPVFGPETDPKGPEILFFEPDSGIAGTEVHIHGNYFSRSAENMMVMVGDSIARITRSGKNDIYIILPDLVITDKARLKVQVYSRTTFAKNEFSFISAWSLKANLPVNMDQRCDLFSLNEKEYVITVYLNAADELINAVWEYDPLKDSWSRKGDFPGVGRTFGAIFTLNGKAYCGMISGDSTTKDFWEYDPSTDFWRRIADYPGHRHFEYQGFSVDGYGYVIETGYDSGDNCELWQYDPLNDLWTHKGNHSEHFTGNLELDGIAYLNNYGHIYNYNAGQDVFNEILNAEKDIYQAFTINNSLYYFELNGTPNIKLWSLDSSTHVWKLISGLHVIDYLSACFSLHNKGYVIIPESKGKMVSFDPVFFDTH